MVEPSPRARIGTSGWDYPDWRGPVYPRELARRDWFGHYAGRFDTVELNSTFYRLPDPETVRQWRLRAPAGFRYAVKMSRYGTHRKHLREPASWVGTFVDRIGGLGDALGPVLVQLPPRWHADPGRLDAFLSAAPRRLRWAVEVRDPSWLGPDVYRVLERHGAALCVHDLLADHPRVMTADFAYLRFHGPDPSAPYEGSYSPQALSGAARRIRRHLAEGRDVYAYFDNDHGGAAVSDAERLRRYLGPAAPGRV